ncbi:MAG: thrombospondin type 3 repeat-containing protein [bacterium]|nr:thrombospondin type 3 repeat-containing protein [bacterium]
MGRILENWRVLIASLFAMVLIVGSFMLARSIESPSSAQASTESALLQAIATKDSDGDGLPDWEEALYGTSPNVTDTFHLGMTDGEAVARGLIVPKAIADIKTATSSLAAMPADGSLPPPAAEGTLTAAFAENFFTLYLSAKATKGGAALSESDMADISNQALSSLASAITPAPDFKSAKDLAISGSGPEALKAFAVQAEAVLMKNTSNASKSEILYLQDAIQKNDTTAFSHIASIAKGYRDSAVGLSALPVPVELAVTDLALINAMVRVSEITADFARANDDPLATILALQQYLPAVQSLGSAFINIGTIYKTAGISLPAGTPGASFVNLIKDIEPKP